MIHSGEKPFKCNLCNYSCNRSHHLTRHKESWHSTRGIQRHKKQEEKIQKLFEQSGISFHREVQIDFKCALGNDRGQSFARIDFVIHRNENTVICVEVDEQEHSDDCYQLSCECRRMADVYTSLITAQPLIQHVLFVRYNPDSFTMNNIRQKPKMIDKQSLLIETIQHFPITKPLEIVYINYSCNTNKTSDDEILHTLYIYNDPDFPNHLRPLCSEVFSSSQQS